MADQSGHANRARILRGRGPHSLLALALIASVARAGTEIPLFEHVVIVIEENRPYSAVIGSPAAPYTAFDSLPTLSIVVPDQLRDIHDSTIAQGHAWLQANLSDYAA